MDVSQIGKLYRCSNCGQEKIIHSEIFSESSDFHSHYCKECYTLLNEKVECRFCNEKVRRKDLAKHLSDYHNTNE